MENVHLWLNGEKKGMIHMKNHKKYKVCLVIAGMGLLLTGCGKGGQENINAGMKAVEAMEYEQALSNFEAALANGEDNRLLYRGQGIAYMGLTQYEDAAKSFEKALANSKIIIDEMDYDINYYLATAYYKSGELNKAVDVYNAILALKDTEKTAYFLRGTIRLEQGDYEAAIQDFDKTISLNKKDYGQLISIYQVLEQNGYKQIGQEYLQAAVETDEKSMTDYERGRINYYLEDYASASTYLERARSAGDEEIILYLGKTYEALGDYNYAASVYSSYLAEHTDSEQIYNQLGMCRIQMGNYEDALQAFQAGKNVEDNSMLQTLQFNEIVAYEYVGEYKKAAVLLESYLKAYPGDETAKRENKFLQTR